MTKYARIENGTVMEIFCPPSGVVITDCFHSEVAELFSICPDDVTPGSKVDGAGNWTVILPPAEDTASANKLDAPKVSPVQFKLLFKVQERVAIKASEDPIVKDFFEIVNDPRLTFVDLGLGSTQEALAYLAGKNLIAADRPAQILTGIIQ